MAFSPLCQLNGGCMGCCGHDFGTKEELAEAIKKNTSELKVANPQTKEEFIQFRDRAHPSDLRSGVCRNLIDEKGCFLCPLHPARHEEDLREGHCDIHYLCKSAKEFELWDEHTKKAFVYFIKSKELSNLDYSIQMDKNIILKEFKELQE